jgi:hypothetical protein
LLKSEPGSTLLCLLPLGLFRAWTGGGLPGQRYMASRDGCGRVMVGEGRDFLHWHSHSHTRTHGVLFIGDKGKRVVTAKSGKRLIPFSGWKLSWSTLPASARRQKPGPARLLARGWRHPSLRLGPTYCLFLSRTVPGRDLHLHLSPQLGLGGPRCLVSLQIAAFYIAPRTSPNCALPDLTCISNQYSKPSPPSSDSDLTRSARVKLGLVVRRA